MNRIRANHPSRYHILMEEEHLNIFKVCLFIEILVLSSFLPQFVPLGEASKNGSKSVLSFQDNNGVRIVFNDIELYFNASNGGEITEYFDLTSDPNRSRNLVNIRWSPYNNLRPLFASLFYHPPPYTGKVLSTGGDPNALVKVLANTSQYVILQTSSRIMSRSGEIAKDVDGNTIYVNSTWIIRNNNLISVERTFDVQSHVTIPSGWRWYPFHFMRTLGFDYNATYYMFNTTYSYSRVVNDETYVNDFTTFAVFPNDTRHVFGVAAPFADTSIGGDGGQNILIAYKYDELVNVNNWRSDNFQMVRYNVTELGAVHQFSDPINVLAHTYHMLVNFTHQPIDEQSVQDFAKYYAESMTTPYLLEANVTTDKSAYTYGDSYTVFGSGIAYYSLTEVTAKLIMKDSVDEVISMRNFGPGNLTDGQTFNTTLLSGTASSSLQLGNYTITFRIFSSAGTMIASDRILVELI